MNKSKVMGIGIGRAGNVLLNDFLHKDKRLSGLFVNSSSGDLEGLDMINLEKNAFLFPMINGSGRDREYAKTFLKDEVQSLADTIARYPLQSDIIIFFSMDGGTGSGITPKFLQVLKRTCPNKTINIVGVLPDYNKVDKLSLENTINCWNEISEIAEKNIVNNIMFIDNSKRESFSQINKEAINVIYNALNMNGKCEYGSIDDMDAKRTFTDIGYGVVLSLNNKFSKVEDAIKDAMTNSVFSLPTDLICNYIAISTKDFSPKELSSAFEYEETCYMANNDEHNTIVFGGCDEPTNGIEYIKLIYDDFINKGNRRDKIKRTHVSIDDKSKTSKKENTTVKTSFTASELEGLFDDLF